MNTAMMQSSVLIPVANGGARGVDSRTAVDGIRCCLEAARDKINTEIGSYPAPISACDVHFNRLLEERAWIFEDLNRLESLRSASALQPGQVATFLRAAKSLDASTVSAL